MITAIASYSHFQYNKDNNINITKHKQRNNKKQEEDKF